MMLSLTAGLDKILCGLGGFIIYEVIELSSSLVPTSCMKKNIIKRYRSRWQTVSFSPILSHKMSIDSRKIVGGDTSALACHVTHLSEYSAKKKKVNCVVISVEKRITKTGRLSTYIHGE